MSFTLILIGFGLPALYVMHRLHRAAQRLNAAEDLVPPRDPLRDGTSHQLVVKASVDRAGPATGRDRTAGGAS